MEVTEQLLGEAILDGNIRFAIQPILDTRTGELMGGEALSRWYTGNGLIAVPTLQYLPLLKRLEWREPFHSILARQWAETAGLLSNIGGAKSYFNFAIDALLDDDCWANIQQEASDNSLFDGVVIELSEMSLSEVGEPELAQASARLSQLQSLDPSVSLALDDFGTALSNLNRLRVWDISTIKLDKQLVSGCDQDPKAQAILRNLRQMAEDLGIELIAEGVETETEEETLLTLGIYSQQGFLRAKPMTQEELIAGHFFPKSSGGM